MIPNPSLAPAIEHLRAVPGVELVEGDADFILTAGVSPVQSRDWKERSVWSFDLHPYSGFWETYSGNPVTTGVLRRYGAGVLERRHFKTDLCSWRANQASLVHGMADAPARLCRLLLAGRPLPEIPAAAETPRTPGGFHQLLLAIRTALRRLKVQVESVLYSEMWRVGVVEAPIDRFLDPSFKPHVDWIPDRRPRHFLADPFLVADGGRLRLLMEEFDYTSHLGRIVESEWENGRLKTPVRAAIDENVHMSYPYPLEHDGQLYCIPESWQKNAVWLYAWDPTAVRWRARQALIEQFAAIDPTIVRYQDRWWLFCTNQRDGVDTGLWIWHAADLLGPWEPHLANPVKVDVRSSRPGGTPFLKDGALYRPAQDCSVSYGWRLAINRVSRLTPAEFEEEVVCVVEPPRGPYRDGIHTLSGSGAFTTLDAKRFTFTPSMIGARLSHKLRRLVGPAVLPAGRRPRRPKAD